MESAILSPPAAESEASAAEAVIAWIDDSQSDEPVPVTAAGSNINYYRSSDNKYVRPLSCLSIGVEGQEPQRYWLPLAALHELESRGVRADAELDVTQGALKRYLAAQALYAEFGQPELRWEF